VNAQDNNGVTPLHLSMSSSLRGISFDDESKASEAEVVETEDAEAELSEDNLTIIELLLEYGADVHVRNDHGKTPLQVASERKRQQVEQLPFRHNEG
jgi:ankyrin repeat protein